MLLQAVLSWGEEAGAPWHSDLPGPLGITPLHLAAVIPDPSQAAALLELLLLRCHGGAAAGASAWRSACTADGLTPKQFALRTGTAAAAEEVLERLGGAGAAGGPSEAGQGAAGQKQERKGEELDPSASVQQPSTPRRCRWGAIS